MSETNETSNLATLADSELDAVAGGVFDFGNLVSQANNATAVGGRRACRTAECVGGLCVGAAVVVRHKQRGYRCERAHGSD